MADVIEISENDFSEKVLESDKPVTLDFAADWCGPCRQLAPVIDDLSREYGDKMSFYRLDVDANPAIATKFQVSSIPTLLVFDKGKEVKRLVGAKPKKAIAADLDEWIS